ncbi:unnamed protein product [Blepharisma stoltei]|uniref:Maturase K n=1 Tax=Blepharisma stoltei TaxID=1481888 RepID=A0AAU9IXJ8_9CILI|nr:unnamed protein product [Blepharisma stoltei]
MKKEIALHPNQYFFRPLMFFIQKSHEKSLIKMKNALESPAWLWIQDLDFYSKCSSIDKICNQQLILNDYRYLWWKYWTKNDRCFLL